MRHTGGLETNLLKQEYVMKKSMFKLACLLVITFAVGMLLVPTETISKASPVATECWEEADANNDCTGRTCCIFEDSDSQTSYIGCGNLVTSLGCWAQ